MERCAEEAGGAPQLPGSGFHTANFFYSALSSSSFVDQLSSANAIDASLRRGDGEGGRPV